MSRSDAALLSEAAQRLPDARKAMLAATGDMPSRGGCEGVSGGGTGEWGPTVTIAMNLGADEAVRDSRRLDKLMLLMAARCRRHQPITQQLAEVVDICDRWAPTARRRQALDANLRAAADDLLNKHDDHGNCRSCARDNKSFKEPFRRGLCVNCYRRVERINELYVEPVDMPPLNLVILFRERGKVTDRDIHNAMSGHVRKDA